MSDRALRMLRRSAPPGASPLDMAIHRLGRAARASARSAIRLAYSIDESCATWKPDLVFVYSSALARCDAAGDLPADTAFVVDFVDADTEKWRAYAAAAAPPLRWCTPAAHDHLAPLRASGDRRRPGRHLHLRRRASLVCRAGWIKSQLR